MDDKAEILSAISQLEEKISARIDNLESRMNERFDDVEFTIKEAFIDIGLVEDKVVEHKHNFHTM